MSDGWWVYVLLSVSGQRTYVGSTTRPQHRLDAHNGLTPGGAKATRPGRPWRIAALHGPFPSRSAAFRLEWALKRLRGRSRLQWPAPEDISASVAPKELT